MMGHNIGFASFHIIEVMSSPIFASKRIGYLAAAQSFSPTTDVLLLTTNQFKKDLTNGKLQDCSQALACLGKLVTEELGRDLEHDLSLLLNSPRPYIRKKALLVLYRLIMVHPDTLPVVSSRFRERLTDKDPGVTCAAVTVTCELARASPKSFLSLAPILYQLLTNKDSNNWMLIKIVKLMGVLTPLEPRLGKKLVEPLTSLMRTTRAKSLLYECCSTVTSGLMAYPEAVELCAQRLGEFMDESDQNLKYLGLLSMRKLIQAHPHLALEHRDNILDCLDDEDIGIRMRALELVSEFVTKRNLRDISRILLKKLRKASVNGFNVEGATIVGPGIDSGAGAYLPITDHEAPYRESLAKQLLRAGEYKRSTEAARAGYEMLSTGDDFAWYTTTVLGGLSEIPLLSVSVRDIIGEQLLELTSRVEALRSISVKVALSLLEARKDPYSEQGEAPTVLASGQEEESTEHGISEDVSAEASNSSTTEELRNTQVKAKGSGRIPKVSSSEALISSNLAGSTAWILGEYAELIEDHRLASETLIAFPQKFLDSSSLVRILTASVKVFVASPDAIAVKVYPQVANYVESLIDNQFAEVQERAWFFKALLNCTGVETRGNLAPLFEGKLIPVDHRAQARIPVSKDLDLDKPLLDTGSDSLFSYLMKTIGDVEESDDTIDDDDGLFNEAVFADTTLSFGGIQSSSIPSYSSQTSLVSSLPQSSNEQNPYYLGTAKRKTRRSTSIDEEQDISRYSYQSGQISSEAAVVIAEEMPHGLDLSNIEKKASAASGRVNKKFEAAFEGAFDDPETRPAGKSGKRKKKKKKRKDGTGKPKKDETKDSKEDSGMSLIDFDAPASAVGHVETTKPKHIADNLLM